MASAGLLTPFVDLSHDRATLTKLRRKAFFFESQRRPLFAWLHQSAQHVGHGVVMCAPLGYEQVHVHRSWRCLADALAAGGMAALRFDYHGVGDSAGCDEDPDRLATWLANIRDAAAFLRESVGCDKISLVGLRMGATLAMLAAAEEQFDNLLLWAPFVRGRNYVREMKALDMTATIKAPPIAESPDDIEAAGFVLTKQTAGELGAIDLRKVTPRCRRALVMARDDVPEDRSLFDHMAAQNIAVSYEKQPGYADMMAEPHFTKVPYQAIERAIDWLHFGDSLPRAGVDRIQPEDAVLAAGVRERVLTIGQSSSLTGILTEPAQSTSKLPLIVMLNAGAAYRIGPSRLHVLLARELASRGFGSLRLDLSGLGDSVPHGSDGANDSYASSAFRDIEATMQFLRDGEHKAERVVLLGLCSGAYFAFQSAVQMAEPRFVESILINPLTFFWKDGMTINDSPTKEDQDFDYYWKSAMQPSKWIKLLSGNAKIGMRGALAKLWRRWQTKHESQSIDGCQADGPAGHPDRDDLTADLARLAQRERSLTCYFAATDPGYHIMTVRAKSKVQELVQAGKMSVTFIDDADHTFSFRKPRRAVIEAICEHLCRQYGRPS